MDVKKLLSIKEVSEIAGVDTATIVDLIDCGDLCAVGSKKDLVRLCDLTKFLGEEPAERPVDFLGQQQYPSTHSILIEDISEMEWNDMEKKGKKEHKPYFDQQKQRWCIALSLGKNAEGKRIRKVISGQTQADAWDAYREFISQQKEVAPVAQDTQLVKEGLAEQLGIATYRPEQDVLFSECFARFLRGIESGIENRTYAGYIASAKYIVDRLGDLKMYEVNREVIQRFLNDLRNDRYCKGKEKPTYHYYSQRYINIVYDLLHRFILAYSDDVIGTALLPKDYMAGMKKPRTKALSPDEPKPYTAKEIGDILNAVKSDPMIYCWIHILAELGCRPSEALALQFSDIDFEKGEINIFKALGKEADFDPVTHKRLSKFRPVIKDLKNDNGRKKKVDFQKRTLKISQKTLDTIQALKNAVSRDKRLSEKKREHGTEDFLFTSRNGELGIYEDYTQRYKRLLKKAGLSGSEMNPYRFRHTVCTDLCRQDMSLKKYR